MTKSITAGILAVSAVLVSVSVSAAQSKAFQGVWKVTSTSGQPFEITLSANGRAKATLRKDMVGTWKAHGQSAVITWKT
jgi:hypothetical protein